LATTISSVEAWEIERRAGQMTLALVPPRACQETIEARAKLALLFGIA
jgi:hypothetical protein